MNKIFSVFRNEIYSLVSRKSFWFASVGIPAIGFLVYAGIGWVNRAQAGSAASPFSQIQEFFSGPENTLPNGYVDLSGLIQTGLPTGDAAHLIKYQDIAQGKADLDANKIGALLVIQPDYLSSGVVKVYMQEYDLLAADSYSDALQDLIDFNLLDGDQKLFGIVQHPLKNLQKESIVITDQPARDSDNAMTFFLPYGVMMLFYVTIMGSSGMLLNSVAKEKENRVVESLLVSVNPYQLLVGKITGLGIVGLFQVFIWAGSAFTLLKLSGQTFNLAAEYQLQPSILGWGLIFYILGYLVYGALMAGIGALVPNLREASQATTIVVIPMVIPLFLLSVLIEKPNSLLTTVFSIFPLTSPTTMMLRLAASTQVPLWQILLAIVLLIITDYLTIRAVAGLFRAQTLLSGQSFKLKRFALALLGKQ